MNRNDFAAICKRRAFILAVMLTTGAILSSPSRAQEQKKEEPKLDDLAVAGAKFGVNFYKGLAASYRAGEAERAYKSASETSILDDDLSSIANAYKAKKEESTATANFTNSTGAVVITGGVALGLASGIGTVPTALFVAGANYGNKQVSIGLREAGEARAMAFLQEATGKWNSTNGLSYQQVRAKLQSGDTEGAVRDFNKATGMLTDLHTQLSGDAPAAQAAQDLVLETMKTAEAATIAQTAGNSSAIKDLANQVQLTQRVVEKTSQALQQYQERLEQTDKTITAASQQITALEQSQSITSQQVGAIEDVLYEQQSPAAKIHLLQHNYRPGLSIEQRQQLISYFEAEKQKEQLIADSAQVVNVAQEVQGILSNIGIHDPTINKAVQIGSVAQKAMSAALTGNYLGAILSVTSLFGGQSDPEAEHFAMIMGYLQQMDRKLDNILDLQVKTLEAIQTLSNQVADMDKRLNLRLDRIDFEIKVISENLKTVMWSPYLSCNTAWQDRDGRGAIKFDNQTFNFPTSREALLFAAQNEGEALDCAKALDNLFLSIKTSKVFGPTLSLSTAASTKFTILPIEQEKGTALTQDDLKRFLSELYQPTVDVVVGAWDPGWGSTATLIATLGDPAPTVAILEEKIDSLDRAKLAQKPFHACSEPTVLSLRLRSLLCVDNRYAVSDVPKTTSTPEENTASQRSAAFMSDPLIRDQLFYLAEWTGLVAQPYDFWTGSETKTFTSAELLAGLAGNGQARGKNVIWSLLSVLDIAVAQQTLLHGDLTTKVIYDLVWDKTAHQPVELKPDQNNQETKAIKLLLNANNPWLGKNVLLMGLRESLYDRNAVGDFSIPYQKAITILNSVEDTGSGNKVGQALSEEQKKAQEKIEAENQSRIQEANFYLRGIFNLPSTVSFTVENNDDGLGGRVRKVLFVSGSYKLELPSPADFANGQLSYPPSLISLLRLRDIMADRFVDYEIVSGIPNEQQRRVAALLFSGLADPRPWEAH